MKLYLFVLFFFLLSICLNSSVKAIIETRYMTSRSITVNGLTANHLNSTSQSSSLASCSVPANSNATWGIMVSKRNSTGYEINITSEPVAKVNRTSGGSGTQSAPWLSPNFQLSINDSIVVRVYVSADGGAWQQCANFTTERLSASNLNSTLWRVYYSTTFGFGGNALFWYGSNFANSRIENFSYVIALEPGEAEFSIPPIYLSDGKIHLAGNLSYLTVYWEAHYTEGFQYDINAICFLNCDKGYDYCSSIQAQNCSVSTPPGKSFACSILNPLLSLESQNNVSCTFYGPGGRESYEEKYINATFIPIEFSVWTLKNYSSLVGEEFNLPIYIKNSGLFSDSYNVTIWVPSWSSNIIIRTENFTTSEIHGDAFDPHAWQQTGPETRDYQIKMVVLDASSNPQVCVDVSSQQMLTKGGMTKGVCMEIKSSSKSMPELGLIQILFIMLAATIFIFKLKKRF
jgi:hypothetical protein